MSFGDVQNLTAHGPGQPTVPDSARASEGVSDWMISGGPLQPKWFCDQLQCYQWLFQFPYQIYIRVVDPGPTSCSWLQGSWSPVCIPYIYIAAIWLNFVVFLKPSSRLIIVSASLRGLFIEESMGMERIWSGCQILKMNLEKRKKKNICWANSGLNHSTYTIHFNSLKPGSRSVWLQATLFMSKLAGISFEIFMQSHILQCRWLITK